MTRHHMETSRKANFQPSSAACQIIKPVRANLSRSKLRFCRGSAHPHKLRHQRQGHPDASSTQRPLREPAQSLVRHHRLSRKFLEACDRMTACHHFSGSPLGILRAWDDWLWNETGRILAVVLPVDNFYGVRYLYTDRRHPGESCC